jgi:hypothetical protein
MKRERLMLKRPSGWFAADQGFVEALELLSEGAFKLYVYACLQADRHTGRIALEPARITRVLRQCPDRIVRHLNELAAKSSRGAAWRLSRCDMVVPVRPIAAWLKTRARSKPTGATSPPPKPSFGKL